MIILIVALAKKLVPQPISVKLVFASCFWGILVMPF
jgi:hypothetical protein